MNSSCFSSAHFRNPQEGPLNIWTCIRLGEQFIRSEFRCFSKSRDFFGEKSKLGSIQVMDVLWCNTFTSLGRYWNIWNSLGLPCLYYQFGVTWCHSNLIVVYIWIYTVVRPSNIGTANIFLQKDRVWQHRVKYLLVAAWLTGSPWSA